MDVWVNPAGLRALQVGSGRQGYLRPVVRQLLREPSDSGASVSPSVRAQSTTFVNSALRGFGARQAPQVGPSCDPSPSWAGGGTEPGRAPPPSTAPSRDASRTRLYGVTLRSVGDPGCRAWGALCVSARLLAGNRGCSCTNDTFRWPLGFPY